ncbi:MAG: ferredoxin [Candidatus Omnitrophica bacterium]|nr:ferredoxin [Candidatus Omnitrophota bacterium]
MKKSAQVEKEAALQAANFMAAAARTAPKTRGIDNIEVVIIDDDATKAKLITRMKDISRAESKPSLERDADSIAGSPAIVLIGVKSNPAGLNCGFCGYPTCNELSNTRGVCSYNSIDLGIAASSAAATASHFYMDNRLMYSIGRAGLDLKLFPGNVKQALGIPLSVTGKNPFFDRK